MDYKPFKVSLDLARENRQAIRPVQGESAAKIIYTLIHNSAPYSLTGTTVIAKYRKKDGTVSFLPGVITDAVAGEVEVTLTNQVLLFSGTVVAIIEVTGDVGIAKSFIHTLDVQPGVEDTSIESVNEYPAIDQAMIDIQSIRNDFDLIVAGLTIDSEVILARQSQVKSGFVFGSLDARLEDIEKDVKAGRIFSYGARRALNATSPLLERIFDASGKVANVPTDDGAAVNDFDSIFPWSHIKECKRDSLGRMHYKGDPAYDLLVNADWLIEIPKFYIRMERTATTFDRVISEFKRAGFWVPSVFKRSDGTECDKIYVGRFKTGKDGAVDVSRPGIFPENQRHLESFRVGARAKGAGWQLIDLSYKTEVLDMLYLVESATFNSQIYLGNGITSVRYVATDTAQLAETAVNRIVILNTVAVNYNVNESICIGTSQGSENIAFDRTILSKTQLDATVTEIIFDGAPVNIAVGNVLWQGAQKNGQTVNLQNPNGKLSGVSGRTSNKYRGMEDIFGNVYEWVDGVLVNDFVAQICRKPEQYSSVLTADYKPAGYANLQSNTYPLEMGFDSNFPEAIFPTDAGGGTTTGLCDYYYQAAGLRGACFGGFANHGSSAGLFYWYLYYAPSAAYWNIGSRLLFKPPV